MGIWNRIRNTEYNIGRFYTQGADRKKERQGDNLKISLVAAAAIN